MDTIDGQGTSRSKDNTGDAHEASRSNVLDRLTQLEDAVRRATDALARMREENERLRRELGRLGDERKQVVAQIDGILHDIAKLELEG